MEGGGGGGNKENEKGGYNGGLGACELRSSFGGCT